MLLLILAPRAVSSLRQAHDARHHGRHAPEGQLPEAFRKLAFLGDDVVFFYGPLYLEVTCSSCLPEEFMLLLFRETTPRNGFRSQHSSLFNSGYMFGVSL